MDTFTTKSTSLYSANVNEPIVLSETSTTRRIFVAKINDAKISSGETVSGYLIHQKKKTDGEWENFETIPLNRLKAGEAVKLTLDSIETKKLYELSKKGVAMGEEQYTVAKANEVLSVPADRKSFIESLIHQNYSNEIWEKIIERDPDLATKFSFSRIYSERKKILEEFKKSLEERADEHYWTVFFKNNDWIFGYGLKYQFLSQNQSQPQYGGSNVTGSGTQKGDFLLSTQTEIRFTVLVEIKKPNTSLVNSKNRSGSYSLSSDLISALTQLQVNSDTWEKQALTPENTDILGTNTYTYSPKSILVIGRTTNLPDRDAIKTFEIFRNNLKHPEIVTFDELYHRAKNIIEKSPTEK